MPITVAVVGGGLVGALAAILFAQQGANVYLFEQRKGKLYNKIEDLRLEKQGQGRSINLALSTRGLAALQMAGLYDKVKDQMLPMTGRLLHVNNRVEFVPYGTFGEAINAMDRNLLNWILLDQAEAMSNVKIFFQHDLQKINFDKMDLQLLDKATDQKLSFNVDFIVGADGCYSTIRKEMMRSARINFSQEYIEHGYMELTIPPKNNMFQMAPNALHIWPRHEFMMIALPNTDKSFTCTLFMPFSKFESIQTEADLLAFFKQNFPDSIDLIGWEALKEQFFNHPVGPLMTVKCFPYHYKNRAVLVGDAAHAMVPFYGQGMNCGFEDLIYLMNALFNTPLPKDALNTFVKENRDLPFAFNVSPKQAGYDSSLFLQDKEQALVRYSEYRHADCVSMTSLALYNYYEMRSNVLSVSYHVRKYLESFLYRFFPFVGVIPLYTMVSFRQIPYGIVWRRWKRQSRFIGVLGGLFIGLGFGALTWLLLNNRKLIQLKAPNKRLPVVENSWGRFMEGGKQFLQTSKDFLLSNYNYLTGQQTPQQQQ